MTGLPRSIIKKYGVSKKAWAVFRGQKATSRGTPKMARRKKSRSGRFRGRKGGKDSSLMMTMIAAGVYGAMRPKVEAFVSPYTAKMPIAGQYTDEVVLGTAGYLLAKGKMPFLKGSVARSAGKAILILESARVGSGISQGISPSSSGSNFDAGSW